MVPSRFLCAQRHTFLIWCVPALWLAFGGQPLAHGQAPAATTDLLTETLKARPPGHEPTGMVVDVLGREQVHALSLREVVNLALENNLDIAISRVNPRMAGQDVITQEAFFDPVFSTTGTSSGYSRRRDPNAVNQVDENGDIIQGVGTVAQSTNDQLLLDARISQQLITGGSLFLQHTYDWSSRANATVGPIVVPLAVNPQHQSSLKLQMTQPLLRGAGVDIAQYQVRKAHKDLNISQQGFVTQLMNSMLEVQVAYYTLIAQIEQLKIARQSLQRAEVLMRNNEVRVRAGAMAPIELKVAQAEVATQRETVVVAENNVRNAERDLKRLLNVERLSIVGDTALVPVDFPKFEAKGIDEAYCLETALGKRPDFLAKKEELERQKVDVKFTRNGLYPQVDVIGSIQLNGLGGAFSDDLERLFSWEYPGVFVGLQMTIPLDGNRAAKASHAKAQLRAAQLLREMKRVELQIVTQVRNSVSNVSTNAQRIETTRVARELRQERLDSAEKLLEVGRITSFEVVTAQEDLAKAQLAELNSTIDYARSLATLSQQMGTILDELRIEVEEPPILR